MHRRLLHVVCVGLNFLHANFVPPPLKAFGAAVGTFVLQLSAFLASTPSLSGDPYADLSGTSVATCDALPALEPEKVFGCVTAPSEWARSVGPKPFPV